MTHRRPFDIINPKARHKILFSLVGAILFSCFVIPASLNIILISQVVAQPGPITPSPPGGSAGLPTIQITSVQDGMQVPPGELTIQGASSDTDDTDCQVFADVNDVSPMQNVTAAGESGDEEDFSIWTFTYTQDYQLITPGQNELTAKISCPPEGGSDLNPLPSGPATAADVPLNEWHTVNVTGVAGAPTATVSPPASDTDEADVAEGVAGEDEADGTDVSGEEGEESEEGEDGDGDIGSDIPSLFG